MAKMHTKQVIDGYYESVKGTSLELTRKQIDKEELYDYEKKIGRELMDMGVEDLFGLIMEFRNKRKGKEINYMISHSSYDQLSTALRAIFNWYIDNVEIIRNPLNDKRMKGKAATKYLAEGKEPFTWKIVEDVIKKLHQEKDGNFADYLEMIMLLFYDGFSKAEEIVMMHEEHLDRKEKCVTVDERIVHLSDRAYYLLEKFNNMREMQSPRGNYLLRGWHNGYFKFIIRPSQKDTIDDRPITSMCDIINRYLAVNVNDRYGVKINYHILYFLGFYNYLVKNLGEDRIKKILLSYRDADDISSLMNMAKKYDLKTESVSHLKKYLMPYIKED